MPFLGLYINHVSGLGSSAVMTVHSHSCDVSNDVTSAIISIASHIKAAYNDIMCVLEFNRLTVRNTLLRKHTFHIPVSHNVGSAED